MFFVKNHLLKIINAKEMVELLDDLKKLIWLILLTENQVLIKN